MDATRSELGNFGKLRWAALIPAAFLTWFFLYPLASILWVAFTTGERSLIELLAVTNMGPVLWFTTWQAALSTGLTLLLAMPATYVFANYDFRGKSAMRVAITIPFVLPTVVVAAAFRALLDPVDLTGTIWAILAAHVFYNVAIVVRTVGGFWEVLDPRFEQAARMLGASRWQAFTTVTLPILRPALAAAASLVFLFTFTSFGVVLLLGNLGHATVEVGIYRRLTVAADFQGAAFLSVVQLIAVTSALLAYSRYQYRGSIQQSLVTKRSWPAKTLRQRGIVFGTMTVTLAMLATPLVLLLHSAFRVSDGYGFDHFVALGERDTAFLVSPLEAITNSLSFALAAATIALVVGSIAAVTIAYTRGRSRRWMDTVLMLPLGTSAVTIGFGFLVALDVPIDLRTSSWLIPIAHAVVAVPFVLRSTLPVMRSVRHQLREAAAILGANPRQTFWSIDVPIVSRALMVGGAFAFAISLGEFGATSFIALPDAPTLPIAIARFLARPSAASFGRAMAMGAILMVVTGASVGLIDRLRVGRSDF